MSWACCTPHGEDVVSNAPLAYAYLGLADAGGVAEAREDLQKLTELLTDRQINHGEQLKKAMQE